MITYELEQILLEELGYAGSSRLVRGRDIPWPNVRAIPNVDAAFLLDNTPVVYFSRFSELDPARIQQLHKSVWSQSKAPLLFAILPHEIRVYNGYEPTPKIDEEFDTPRRLLQELRDLTDHLTARKLIRSQLT